MEPGVQSAPPFTPDYPSKSLKRQRDFATTPCAAPSPAAVPSTSQPSASITVKLDSPRSRSQGVFDGKDGTPKKQKHCNCKHSKCLKLYCECFASGIYCDGCNCANCCNNVENETARQEAVEATLERNPNAFRPKIGNSPHAERDIGETGDLPLIGKHNKGCHCKKSSCLKKYCECFQANILCSENCKCMDCKNFERSEERKALLHSDHGNHLTSMHQAANAALNGTYYGFPLASKRRKNPEILLGTAAKVHSVHRPQQFLQVGHLMTSGPASSLGSVPLPHVNPAQMGPCKFTYRPLLADIVQEEHATKLCKHLVAVSAEAAKTVIGKIVQEAIQAEMGNQMDSYLVSAKENKDEGQQREADAQKAPTDHSNGNHADNLNTESVSESTSEQKDGRPMSPGTLALMCDEQDTMFMTFENTRASPRFSSTQNMTEIYAVQEKCILIGLRNCLRKLVDCGRMKEANYSLIAVMPETSSHQEAVTNNIPEAPLPKAAEESQPANAMLSSPSNSLPLKVGLSVAENGNMETKVKNS